MFSVGAVPSDTTVPSGRSNNIPAIVAAVLAVTVLAAVIISAAVMILIILRRKRKTKETTITAVHYTRDESEGLNPLYSGECMHIASHPKKHCILL